MGSKNKNSHGKSEAEH